MELCLIHVRILVEIDWEEYYTCAIEIDFGLHLTEFPLFSEKRVSFAVPDELTFDLESEIPE